MKVGGVTSWGCYAGGGGVEREKEEGVRFFTFRFFNILNILPWVIVISLLLYNCMRENP